MLRKNLVVLVLLCLVSACGELDQLRKSANIEKPAVTLNQVQLTAIGLDRADFTIALNIDNPNPVSIKLAGFDYALLIDGKQFIRGEQNNAVSIEAEKVKTLSVPLSVKFADLQRISENLASQDEFAYEIQTTARIDLPVLGIRSFPASIEGRLPIPHLPRLSIQDLSIDTLSLTSVRLRVKVGIDNNNVFGLELSDIDYNLAVNGQRWLQSTIRKPILLKPRGSTSVEVPLQLNLLQLGSTLYNSLDQAEPLTYQLKGNLQLDTGLPALKGARLPFSYSGRIAPTP